MSARDPWIDCLKAIGMLLVFHGHLVELAYDETVSNTGLFIQFQAIYAFHMPLFFFLSGYVAKPPVSSFGAFLSGKFLGLVVPATFFVLTVGALYTGLNALNGDPNLHKAARILLSPLAGHPAAAWPTWFLFCMFTGYALFWLTYPIYRRIGAWLFLPVLFAIASVSILKIEFFTLALHIQQNFWYVSNAPMACLFLYLGHIAAGYRLHPTRLPKPVLLILGLAALGLCWWVAALNTGLPKGAVILALAQIGNPGLFLAAALLGILGIGCLTQLLVKLPLLETAGRVSLAMLFFACVFFQFGNAYLLDWFGPAITSAPVAMTAVLTAICYGLSLPLAILMQRAFPQLLGAPRVSGPVFPALQRS